RASASASNPALLDPQGGAANSCVPLAERQDTQRFDVHPAAHARGARIGHDLEAVAALGLDLVVARGPGIAPPPHEAGEPAVRETLPLRPAGEQLLLS